jgi:RimJ/RimL family protein N-acetyltransferase
VEAARGRGYATEALTALVAAAEEAGARVRASVLPDNAPSLRVLATCGFTDLRGSNEDGELVMARPLR